MEANEPCLPSQFPYQLVRRASFETARPHVTALNRLSPCGYVRRGNKTDGRTTPGGGGEAGSKPAESIGRHDRAASKRKRNAKESRLEFYEHIDEAAETRKTIDTAARAIRNATASARVHDARRIVGDLCRGLDFS